MKQMLALEFDNLVIVLYLIIADGTDLLRLRILVNRRNFFPLEIVRLFCFVIFCFEKGSCLLFEPIFGRCLTDTITRPESGIYSISYGPFFINRRQMT